MRLEFHPSTFEDADDALSYYQLARPGLEFEFKQELNIALARIAESPLLFPVVETQIRRCIVHRFPYSILFRVLDFECVRVLAIRHHKRHSQFGMARK